jgi:hypothetical protein
MTTSAPGRAQATVRRILLFVILFALVTVAAIGVSGLLESLFVGSEVISGSQGTLARSLAFTVIGAPLAVLLWWWERRRLQDPAERDSVAWPLYLIAMSTTALVTATFALGTVLAVAAVGGRWRVGDLAVGVVWLIVWMLHRFVAQRPATAPTRLVTVSGLIGSTFGLAVAASGAVTALAELLTPVLDGFAVPIVGSSGWGGRVAQGLIWAALGALVWWWHWHRERAGRARGSFAAVVIVVIIGVSAAATVFATATLLWIGLRLLFDRSTETVAEITAPLDLALAVALVAGVVWAAHGVVLSRWTPRVRDAARLVVSGVGLLGAAIGFGVVVNALLASITSVVVDDDPRTLLLAGVSALVVSAPVWWLAWRPTRRVTAAEAADPARRVFLVAIFGASAIVAIVTILLIGYRLFEAVLGSQSMDVVIERVRAPLGLLSATALVFAYHFTVWRADRRAVPSAPRPAFGRVTLMIDEGAAGDALVQRVRAATGARVDVWPSAAGEPGLSDAHADAVVAALGAVAAALAGADGAPQNPDGRVLVLPETGGGVRTVRLKG